MLVILFYSLYQEVPCLNGEVQTVTLQPGRSWRFTSPDFPSAEGFPDDQECTWKFRAGHEMIGDVKITCDHFDVEGNFFNGCEDSSYMAVKHIIDDWDDDQDYGNEKLCGDLTSWVPLSNFWKLPKKSNRTAKGKSREVRNILVRFHSKERGSGSGFSCRIVGMMRNDTTTTTVSTTTSTTTTTTAAPDDSCPEPDDNFCACGRVKNFGRWRTGRSERSTDPMRIVGGQETRPHQYPWQVGISYYDYIMCGGTLITQRHVMTAAHCTVYLTDLDFEGNIYSHSKQTTVV